jgi:antitoxin StbD
MRLILASLCVSISELNKNPLALLNQAKDGVVAILKHNKPAAYLVSAEKFELLMERLEDYELEGLVKERQSEKAFAIEVALDDL